MRFHRMFLFVLAAGFLSTGCMTVRDQVAVRLGLPKYADKGEYENQRYRYLAAKHGQSREMRTVRTEQFFQLQPVRQEPVLSRIYPELVNKYTHDRESRQNTQHFVGLEKESARLRWETKLLHKEAQDLREELAQLTAKWDVMAQALERVEMDRNKLSSAMSRLDNELEKSYSRIEAIESERSQMARLVRQGTMGETGKPSVSHPDFK